MDINGNFALPKSNGIVAINCNEDEEIQIGEDVFVWFRKNKNGGTRRTIYISAPREIIIGRPRRESSEQQIHEGTNKGVGA